MDVLIQSISYYLQLCIMRVKKNIWQQKRKRTKNISKKHNITSSEKVWIKDLPPIKIKAIESGFKDGKYLPFYTSSGTSVITSRKPPDFQELYLKKSEFQYYIPDLFKNSTPEGKNLRRKRASNRRKNAKTSFVAFIISKARKYERTINRSDKGA